MLCHQRTYDRIRTSSRDDFVAHDPANYSMSRDRLHNSQPSSALRIVDPIHLTGSCILATHTPHGSSVPAPRYVTSGHSKFHTPRATQHLLFHHSLTHAIIIITLTQRNIVLSSSRIYRRSDYAVILYATFHCTACFRLNYSSNNYLTTLWERDHRSPQVSGRRYDIHHELKLHTYRVMGRASRSGSIFHGAAHRFSFSY